MRSPAEAVVVGSGPNGLAAAISLARAGVSTTVLEAAPTPGGGARSMALTGAGHLHDVCSAIHPLAGASPFFTDIGPALADHGVQWTYPEVPLAHPLDGGRAAVMHQDLARTVDGLGRGGPWWDRVVGPAVRSWERLLPTTMGPVVRVPRHPLTMAAFGVRAVTPTTVLAAAARSAETAALFAGCAAHAFLPLDRPMTSGFGIMLAASGHVADWPAIRGGTGRLTDALVAIFESLGGSIRCEAPVRRFSDVPPARAVLFDLTPRQVVAICGERFPSRYRRRLEGFRYGPGAFKVDYVLSEPVPWASAACGRAGTVHVGGSMAEIHEAELACARGQVPDRPFVLVAQQSLFDPTRAPGGGHTLWTYAHVPAGCTVDMTSRIEAQIERFAPGFADTIVRRHVASPAWLESYNANNVGGDIGGGAHDRLQLVARPVLTRDPYRTPDPAIFLCSSSTPPGGGVHGMCGANAAERVLADRFC